MSAMLLSFSTLSFGMQSLTVDAKHFSFSWFIIIAFYIVVSSPNFQYTEQQYF
jgi:hypothetical protein